LCFEIHLLDSFFPAGDPRGSTFTVGISEPQSGIRSATFKLYQVDIRTNARTLSKSLSVDAQCTKGTSGCTCTPADFCYKSTLSARLDELQTTDIGNGQRLRLEVELVNRAGLTNGASGIDVEADLFPPKAGKIVLWMIEVVHGSIADADYRTCVRWQQPQQ